MGVADIIKSVTGLPEPVVTLSCDFLRALGYPVNELWGSVGDGIKARRIGRILRIIKRTRDLAEDQDIAVEKGVVHEAFFFPFLDGAQDAGDEDLEGWWARLLASAIQTPWSQHPAYPQCLRQLVRDETIILAYMADKRGSVRLTPPYRGSEFRAVLHTSGYPHRVNLSPPELHHPVMTTAYVDHLVSLGLLAADPEGTAGHSMSRFGYTFLRACGVVASTAMNPKDEPFGS